MNDEQHMWEGLSERQQVLLASVHEHQRLCLAVTPDRHALAASRWRVAQAGRNRMEYLIGTVFPAVEAACTGAERQRVIALRDGTSAYQRYVSAYVTRWTTDAIIADWVRYREEAQPFRAAILSRITQETAVLRPVLRRVGMMTMPAAL